MAGYVTVPLPARLDDKPVTWGPWKTAPTMTHYPPGCTVCKQTDQTFRTTFGTVEIGRRPITRFFALRCPRCEDTRVIRVTGAGDGVIWHHRGGVTGGGYAGHAPVGLDCAHTGHAPGGICRPLIVCAACGEDWPCPIGAAYAAGLTAGTDQ